MRLILGVALGALLSGCQGEVVVNHAPVVVPPGDLVVSLGDVLTVEIEASDPDGDALVLEMVDGPSAAVLTDETLSWTPTASDVGTHDCLISVTDDGDPPLTGYAEFTATVVDPDEPGVNHPPELVPPDDQVVEVGDEMSLTLVYDDPDADTVTLAIESGPAAATLVGDVLSWSPVVGDVGAHGFVLSATDDGVPALTDFAVFTATVVDPDAPGVNHPPEADPIADQLVEAGVEVSFSVSATDPDEDTLSWSAEQKPTGAVFVPATRAFSWTPTAGQEGTHYALFKVTDDGTPPLSDFVLVRIDVWVPGGGNLPPTFFSVPAPGLVDACQDFTASFEAIDPDGDDVEYVAFDLPDGATLTPDGTTGVLDWRPTSEQTGVFEIVVYAIDDGWPTMSSGVPYSIEVGPVVGPVSIPPPSRMSRSRGAKRRSWRSTTTTVSPSRFPHCRQARSGTRERERSPGSRRPTTWASTTLR
jgi:hypothetical protein